MHKRSLETSLSILQLSESLLILNIFVLDVVSFEIEALYLY